MVALFPSQRSRRIHRPFLSYEMEDCIEGLGCGCEGGCKGHGEGLVCFMSTWGRGVCRERQALTRCITLC